jgi:hypothetical protein
MSPLARSLWTLAIAFLFAGCGEPERAKPAAIRPGAARAGGEFAQVGTVTLYPGESCASQIMFVFHSGSGSISVAAPWRESRILMDAVHSHRNVRIVGKWKHGKTPDCSYIEATQVEVQKSLW